MNVIVRENTLFGLDVTTRYIVVDRNDFGSRAGTDLRNKYAKTTIPKT